MSNGVVAIQIIFLFVVVDTANLNTKIIAHVTFIIMKIIRVHGANVKSAVIFLEKNNTKKS